MNRKNPRLNRNGREMSAVVQLEGLLDLGMKKEALRLSAAVLENPQSDPDAISEALRAIGVFAHRMKSWKPRVERMLTRLSKKKRHAIREMLLMFFAAIEDYERAASFIVAPRRFTPEGFYMAVETLVELRRFEDARKLASSHPEYESAGADNDYLCEAFASAAATNGDHLVSLVDRINSPMDSPLSKNIIEGTVESAFAMTIQNLGSRLQEIQERRREFDETEITIPGVHDSLLDDEEKLCLRWRNRLIKMIPKERRFRYALDP